MLLIDKIILANKIYFFKQKLPKVFFDFSILFFVTKKITYLNTPKKRISKNIFKFFLYFRKKSHRESAFSVTLKHYTNKLHNDLHPVIKSLTA